MGNGGGGFLAAMKSKIGKKRVGQGTSDFRKSVAVKEKKGCPPMARLEELKGFQQCQCGRAVLFPFFCNRRMSF
jgi:hypothetical protein